jgi:multiple sugar transport system ATP-binding protein
MPFTKKNAEPVKEAPKADKPGEVKDVKAAAKPGEAVKPAEASKPAAPANQPKPTAYVSLRHIDKIYDNNVQAVFDFNLDIKKKEFIVFVGPSGCGKSTTLRMIAGLEDISHGELWIDGEYSNDRTPKDRDIAMVFQSYALYPHMTVYNNMAFGLKIRHLPKEEIDRRVREAAKILQIEEYLDRKPKALSGGQRQRVALGRAIVRNAKVFLMDEPLSNLDAKLRVSMRSEIIKLTEALGATTIYVTHDQTEAMTMASRIVVMKLGRIQQIGSPIEIYNQPNNLFVAGFIGSPSMNFLKATYDKGVLTFQSGVKIKLSKAAIDAHLAFYSAKVKEEDAQIKTLSAKLASIAGGDEALSKQIEELKAQLAKDQSAESVPHDVIYGIRPEDIHEVGLGDKGLGDPYTIKVAVAELLGHEYYVHSDFNGIDLVAKIPLTHEIKIGDSLQIAFTLEKAHIFDPISEKRIY